MEVTLEVDFLFGLLNLFHVSILILMEVTLEETKKNAETVNSACFNPYSNGSYSGRTVGYILRFREVFVSILILMEVTLEDERLQLEGFSCIMFQSLF